MTVDTARHRTPGQPQAALRFKRQGTRSVTTGVCAAPALAVLSARL